MTEEERDMSDEMTVDEIVGDCWLTTPEKQQLRRRIRQALTAVHRKGQESMRERAAACVHVGSMPCDCAEFEQGCWRSECHCDKYDDCARIAEWCEAANINAKIRALPLRET